MKEKNKRNFRLWERRLHKSARLRRIDCWNVYPRELLTNIYVSESVLRSKCTGITGIFTEGDGKF